MLEDTIVAVVADHGGYKNTHRITPPMIAEVYVPILLRGRGNHLPFLSVMRLPWTVLGQGVDWVATQPPFDST